MGALISIVIPAYNEAGNIFPLVGEIDEVCRRHRLIREVILVDDGSEDSTACEILQSGLVFHNVRAVSLEKNRGKGVALRQGFLEARGEILITMDADGQDDPREIPGFLEHLNAGFHLVVGHRVKRADGWWKRSQSRLFNWGTRLVSGVPVRDQNCGFKCLRRNLLNHVPINEDSFRYLASLSHLQGFRVGEKPVTHRPRQNGRSKYGFGRALRCGPSLIALYFKDRRQASSRPEVLDPSAVFLGPGV